MAYAKDVGDGVWIEIAGPVRVPLTLTVERPDGPVEETDEIEVTPAWVEGLTEEERAAFGFKTIIEVEAPAGIDQAATPGPLEDHDGSPRQTWVVENIPLAAAKARAIELIRQRRWECEQLGVEIAPGVRLKGDKVTEDRINSALAFLDRDPETTSVDWEVSPGVFTTLDGVGLTAAGVALGRRLQACFSVSRIRIDAVNAASNAAEVQAVIGALADGWPE